jgi:SAM-dependent methyltransferase
MNKYFSGEYLYGDDFTIEQIKKWYEDEAEAYSNLRNEAEHHYRYYYHQLNWQHGFKYLKQINFENVLGIGAAWGHEFLPIIDKIKNLTIIEPSKRLRSEKIRNITPNYVMPEIDGKICMPDDTFDLVTSFGTLHHIPNVSFVIAELYRVTKPGGHILIREPIISMGDWTKPRKGLTKHERGIPLNIFRSICLQLRAEIVCQTYCFTMTALFQRAWKKLSKRPIFSFGVYVWFDKWFSHMLKKNLKYHATTKLGRIAPQSVFYVLRKPLDLNSPRATEKCLN